MKILQISKSYLYVRPMRWLLDSALMRYLILNVLPFIRLSLYYTSMRGRQYSRGYKALKTGDIILTLDKKKLTTYLIPGEFSHAGFCVEKGHPDWEISEMTHSHYTKSHFFDMCKESDRVIILRPTNWDEEYLRNVISVCRTLDGAKYDHAFKLGTQTLYCSELIYYCDYEHRLALDLSDLVGLGRPYISPTGILHSKNVTLIWDSDLAR